jgi:hypothetical protein
MSTSGVQNDWLIASPAASCSPMLGPARMERSGLYSVRIPVSRWVPAGDCFVDLAAA